MLQLAADTMISQIREIVRHAHIATDPGEPEGVHQMRVYSRRLRASLRAFDPVLPKPQKKTWAKRVKRITKSLGDARDADVQAIFLEKTLKKLNDDKARPGLERLLLRTQQQRRKCQPDVEAVVRDVLDKHVLDLMAESLRTLQVNDRLSPPPEVLSEVSISETQTSTSPGEPAVYGHAMRSILEQLEKFLAYQPLPVHLHEAETLHQMRIAGKRLRYTIENFQPAYAGRLDAAHKTLKKLQDDLGDIHDCDVWRERLPAFIEAERQRTLDYFGHLRSFKRLCYGLEWLIQHQVDERRRLGEHLHSNWRQAAADGVWDDLRQTLAVAPPPPEVSTPPETEGSTDTYG